MSRVDMLKKIKELESNPEFIEEMKSLRTTAELVALFTEAGLPITESDMEDVYKLSLSDDGELSECSLDNVSGGCIVWGPIKHLYWLYRWVGGRAWYI